MIAPSDYLIKEGFSPRVVPPAGDGSSQIMVMAEAPGRHEDTDLVPLHPKADAGSIFARVLRLAKTSRESLTITNACWCFLSARTSIYTPEKYKEIHTLKVGDLVLTHTGKFKPIIGIYKQLGVVDAIKVTLQHTQYGKHTCISHACVSTNHRFMNTSGDWAVANELQVGNELAVLADRCVQCNSIFSRSFRKVGKALPFCSLRCHQVFSTHKGLEKIRAYMVEEFRSGRRDGHALGVAGGAAYKRMVEEGFKRKWNEEIRQNSRLKGAATRQLLGLAGSTWLGFGEHNLGDLLDMAEYEYDSQFALEGYNYDFRVGKTLLEIDGPGSHNVVRRNRDAIKLEVAERNGFEVVHIPHDRVETALEILKNHANEFCFTGAKIVCVEPFRWIKGTWTLGVEGDESYVGQGLVNHNSRPPNNELDGWPYEKEAIEYWKPHNERLILERKPKVLILMGNVAMRAFTPYGRVEDRMITNLANYAIPLEICGHPLIALFTLHPSFILHGQQAFTQTLIWDIQRAHQLVRDGLRPHPTRYITSLSLDEAESFERGFIPSHHLLAHDIETPESSKLDEEKTEDETADLSYDIRRISLCYDGENGYAVSWPWQEPFISISKRMIAKAERLEVWNKIFDCPRLIASGCTYNGRIYDRMRSFKFLQPTLPRSLEFATPLLGWNNPPWKFLNESEPALYSAIDSHALRFNGIAIEKALKDRGVFELHERHVVECYEVLDLMSRNGLPYDIQEAARFQAKLEKMREEREAELQIRVPDSLKLSHPKLGYKKTPKDLTGLTQRQFTLPRSSLTKAELSFVQSSSVIEQVVVTRWCKLEPFNPNSPGENGQMAKLIKSYGHKLATNRKTKKGTTDDESIRKLLRKCMESSKPRDKEFGEILKMCRECRQLGKVLSTYVEGWKPGKDGRIHSTAGDWGKMYRVSWRRPNIAATIADKQEEYIAAGFRECVAAPKGKLLVESDWKGFEAVLVGYFAGDPDYMRLARLGVHDYLCCHVLAAKGKILQSDIPSLSLSDTELSAIFKYFKKKFPKDRDDSKHIVHGSNYLATPPLISSMYEMPINITEQIQEIYFDKVANKVRAWQNATLEKVAKEIWLTNPWGFRMAFWDIHHWNSQRFERLQKLWAKHQGFDPSGMRYKLNKNDQEWVDRIQSFLDKGMKLEDAFSKLSYDQGEDAKSAVSFLPRDTAAAMLKDRLLDLRWLAEERVLLNSTHDSMMGEVEESRVEWLARILKDTMEAPFKLLSNLVIGTEVKVGPNWGEGMEVINLDSLVKNEVAIST